VIAIVLPACNVDAPPVLILVLAAVEAPASSAYAVGGVIINGEVSKPMERRVVATLPS